MKRILYVYSFGRRTFFDFFYDAINIKQQNAFSFLHFHYSDFEVPIIWKYVRSHYDLLVVGWWQKKKINLIKVKNIKKKNENFPHSISVRIIYWILLLELKTETYVSLNQIFEYFGAKVLSHRVCYSARMNQCENVIHFTLLSVELARQKKKHRENRAHYSEHWTVDRKIGWKFTLVDFHFFFFSLLTSFVNLFTKCRFSFGLPLCTTCLCLCLYVSPFFVEMKWKSIKLTISKSSVSFMISVQFHSLPSHFYYFSLFYLCFFFIMWWLYCSNLPWIDYVIRVQRLYLPNLGWWSIKHGQACIQLDWIVLLSPHKQSTKHISKGETKNSRKTRHNFNDELRAVTEIKKNANANVKEFNKNGIVFICQMLLCVQQFQSFI